jgi:hypothetical protein
MDQDREDLVSLVLDFVRVDDKIEQTVSDRHYDPFRRDEHRRKLSEERADLWTKIRDHAHKIGEE